MKMNMFHNLTTKEWLLGLLLHIYIGGFAYFWGASTNDPYLIIVFSFLVTQLVSGHLTLNVIMQREMHYRLSNRHARLFLNFAVNVLLANLLVPLIRVIHPGDMAEFLGGPLVYGMMFGVLYYLYFLLSLSPMAEAGTERH